MLDWLRYKWELARLQSKKKNAVRLKMKEWNNLRQAGETEKLLNLDRSNIEPFDEDIEHLISSYFFTTAQKFLLLLPESSDSWSWSKYRHHFTLQPAEIQELRSAIRTEKKEKSELAFRWLTSLTD